MIVDYTHSACLIYYTLLAESQSRQSPAVAALYSLATFSGARDCISAHDIRVILMGTNGCMMDPNAGAGGTLKRITILETENGIP